MRILNATEMEFVAGGYDGEGGGYDGGDVGYDGGDADIGGLGCNLLAGAVGVSVTAISTPLADVIAAALTQQACETLTGDAGDAGDAGGYVGFDGPG